MKRIGIAFTAPRGPNARRDEYGLYANGTCRYEGYRETRPDGETLVGLPLAGPNAAHSHPLVPFVESNFAEVRRFDRYVLHTPGLRPYTLGRGTTEAQATSIATLSATRHGVSVRVTRGGELVAVCEPQQS